MHKWIPNSIAENVVTRWVNEFNITKPASTRHLTDIVADLDLPTFHDDSLDTIELAPANFLQKSSAERQTYQTLRRQESMAMFYNFEIDE